MLQHCTLLYYTADVAVDVVADTVVVVSAAAAVPAIISQGLTSHGFRSFQALHICNERPTSVAKVPPLRHLSARKQEHG